MMLTELSTENRDVVQRWMKQCLSLLKGCDYRMNRYLTGQENAVLTIGDLDLAQAFIARTRKELIAAHGLKDFPEVNMEI